MVTRLADLHRDEQGLSALETAIVLIAFVVVAAVFAFTMLSAGMFATERSKEAVYAGLEEVRGSMELRGSVIGKAKHTGADEDACLDVLVFTVSNVAGGGPVDMAAPPNNKIVIDYRDEYQVKRDLEWYVSWLVRHDTDELLEEGELAKLTIGGFGVGGGNELDPILGISTPFALEIKPPNGSVLIIERRTPDNIDAVMDLR